MMSNFGIFNKIVNESLCISCGICEGYAPNYISMRFDKTVGMFYPEQIGDMGKQIEKELLMICPGKGYPIVSLSAQLHPDSTYHSIDLGRWNKIWAMQTKDEELLINSSSGGVMTSFAEYLLNTKQVDGVIVTGMEYNKGLPLPVGYIAKSRTELLSSQGSKYCPSPTMSILKQAIQNGGKYAFIGTPCQIAGLVSAAQHNSDIKNIIAFTISNFCGGFRDYRETERLIKKNGIHIDEVISLRYRGDGQPGKMSIQDSRGKIVKLAYPQYAKKTGIMKHYRCRSCVDATGELADISCGDAWIKRFLEKRKGWSIVISRNQKSDKLIQEMIKNTILNIEQLEPSDVLNSQKTNIQSKKYRQKARRLLYRVLHIALPEFDGGFHPTTASGYMLEIKVHFSTLVFHYAELLGIYEILIKLLKRKA